MKDSHHETIWPNIAILAPRNMTCEMYLPLLQEEFEEYAEKAKTLPDNTTNENKLILYGLYKQATVGNVNTG